MLHIFGIIAGVLALVSAIPYIIDTVKGTTKPNRVTWLIWVTLQIIALVAQFSAGGRDSLLLTIGDLLASSTILFLALLKGEAAWHWIDTGALVGAAAGLLMWYFFHQPAWALAMTIFVDFCGVVPTIRKSFADPFSETLSTWLLVAVGAVFGAIAVGKLDITLLIYPLYLITANLGVAFAIQFGKLKITKSKPM
jgi:hypothetical protein